jgi:uncharacterized protein
MNWAQACLLIVLFLGSLPASAQPLADWHQHLFSPAAVARSPTLRVIDAAELIRLLDAAHIQRAVVLSTAYQLGSPNRPPVDDEYTRVKAENDWTSRQVALFPRRLRGFCSFNPLKDYALAELERCYADPQLRSGIKLHIGNSDVDLDNPAHVEHLRQVFRAANAHDMAIVVHLRSSISRARPYGSKQARTFLAEVLSQAPRSVIQIAHFAGAGSYEDPKVDEAMRVFIEAIRKADPRVANVYFDVSGVTGLGKWRTRADVIAMRIREVGLRRVLFGSDGAAGGNLAPKQAWETFRKTFPPWRPTPRPGLRC